MTAVLNLARNILDDTRSWGDQAACIGLAHILESDDTDAAKRLCLGDPATGQPRCPVINACHAWVIPLKGKNDPGGVKAGRTEDERNDFRAGRTGHQPTRTGEKECRRCKLPKPVSEFTRHRRHNDGLASYCKPCEAERQAAKRGKTAA
jgi:hypothetical protein